MGLGDVLAIRTAAEQHVKRVEEDAKALRIALDDDSVYGLAVEERDRASAAVEAAGAAIEAMINSTITAVVAIRRREQAEAAANRRAEIVALEAAGMDANPDGLRQAGTLADRATMAALMVEEVAISNNAEAAHLEALGA